MNLPRFLRFASVLIAMCLLTACSTGTGSRQARVLPGVKTMPSTPPPDLPELGKLAVTAVFEDSTVRIQAPPSRAEAVRDATHLGKESSCAGSTSGPVGPGSEGLVLLGGVEMAVVAVTPIARMFAGIDAGLSGIPSDLHQPAKTALIRANEHRPLSTLVIRRILDSDRESSSALFNATSQTGRVDTILELYDGERSLRGNGGLNPVMHLQIGYRCTLIRARDQKALHVFRVNYTSPGHKFVEWGANDAELFQEEMDKALSSLAGQIRAQLEMIEANAHQTSAAHLARSQTN